MESLSTKSTENEMDSDRFSENIQLMNNLNMLSRTRDTTKSRRPLRRLSVARSESVASKPMRITNATKRNSVSTVNNQRVIRRNSTASKITTN